MDGSQRSARKKKEKKKKEKEEKENLSARLKRTLNKSKRKKKEKKVKDGSIRAVKKKKSPTNVPTRPPTKDKLTAQELKDPRNVDIFMNDVGDDDVKRAMKQYKQRKTYVNPTPFTEKEELILDRVDKKQSKMMIPTLNSSKSELSESLKSKNTPVDCKQSEDNMNKKGNKKAAEQTERQEPTMVEKNNETSKHEGPMGNRADNLYLPNGKFFWQEVLVPNDDDLKDVEAVFSIGSEHIEMYYERKLRLISPPESTVVLDQWEILKVLMKRDRIFFTPELIFSNTLRSVISANPKEELKQQVQAQSLENDTLRQTQCDDTHPLIFLDFPTQGFTYEKSDPIGSSSKRMMVSKQELNCQQVKTVRVSR
ncbi:unnamed protein product [Caenorhabditis angaria]|uniref:Uncharacterized protein n=1 Tax=Caenorhabditis angaria TaxID=860376 RepID=A0A9P1IBI1_9PELO|nr:unnamed protein product [Caenorhabditis angaria]